MSCFFLSRRLLCIFGTRLSFILMNLQVHKCPLGPVFMIFSKNIVFRRQYANILVVKLNYIRKRYGSIFLTSRLLFIFGTRLSFILMKQQTHQCHLEPVFMISSKNVILRKQYAKILVAKLKHIGKRYESVTLNQETAMYFCYKILYILMKLLTNQCPLGPVFVIFSKNNVLRRQYAKILVAKIKHIHQKKGMNHF